MKKLLLIALAITWIFMSCSQDNERAFSVTSGQATVIGQIVNSNYEPLEGARIESSNLITESDQDGIFILNKISVDDNTAFIKAFKDGYHHASRTHFTITNTDNFIKIIMLDKKLEGQFNAANGDRVELPDNIVLTFNPSSIIASSGANYDGDVNVYFAYLDPNDKDFSEKMPGNLIGQRLDNSEQFLTSYGMIAVELEDPQGNALQIKDGSTATLEIPIPESYTNTISEIPLWSFDENTGYWKEESLATVEGDHMIGEVSHFSWWNCDLPLPTITAQFKFRLQEDGAENSNVFSLTPGCIERSIGSQGQQTICGHLDINGDLLIELPANEKMELHLRHPCKESMFETTIGPYTENIIEEVKIDNHGLHSVDIIGNLLSCSKSNVDDGYILVKNAQNIHSIRKIENGAFHVEALVCSSEIELFGVNRTENQRTLTRTYPIADTIHVGDIQACSDLKEHLSFSYTVEGKYTEHTFESISFVNADRPFIISNDNNTSDPGRVQFFFPLNNNNGATDLGYQNTDPNIIISNPNRARGITTIHYKGNVGEYVEGIFTVDGLSYIVNNTAQPLNVTGSFRVLRKE